MSAPTFWYVHPYAGGPGVGRYHRPFELGRAWQAVGARVVVITAAFHHLLDTPNRLKGARDIDGVPYAFLATPSYAGNGLGRLVNMVVFSVQLLRNAVALARRYGTPDMIIGSSPHPYVFPATHRLARRFGAVSVFEVRDLWPLSLIELAGVSPKHPLVRLTDRLERSAYRHADAVVSLMPNTRAHHKASASSSTCARRRPDRCHPRWQRRRSEAPASPGARASTCKTASPSTRRSPKRACSPCCSMRTSATSPCARSRCFVLASARTNCSTACWRGYPWSSPSRPVMIPCASDHYCGYSVAPGNIPQIADALAALASLPAAERRAMGERGLQYAQQEHGYPLLAARYLRILASQQQGQP